MSSFSNKNPVTFSVEEFIGVLKMEDPSGKNGLRPLFVEDLIRGLHEAKNNQSIKVLILAGMKDVFCSGADLETLIKLCKNEIKPVDIVLTKLLLDLPIPVISAMEGHAIGGGFAIGLCADIAVLAEESRYGCSFMNMGFTPGMGVTKLMEHYMSPAVAQEMQYTGTNYLGKDLVGITNFNYILPKDQVMEKAYILAHAISEKSRKALITLKRYQSMARRKVFEETYTLETMMHEITFDGNEIIKLIQENYVRY
jgi:polyketide biosynthesis enoyl-CoA hydratase PksI